jgi:hypothetical protein
MRRTLECPFCRDSAEPGWVCAEHPDQPRGHDGCGAPGVPCVCNPKSAVRWAQVYVEASHPGNEPLH